MKFQIMSSIKVLMMIFIMFTSCTNEQTKALNEQDQIVLDEKWEIVKQPASGKPVWVNSLSFYIHHHPNHKYYVGRGLGYTIVKAKENAINDLISNTGIDREDVGEVVRDEYWQEWKIIGRKDVSRDRTVFEYFILIIIE